MSHILHDGCMYATVSHLIRRMYVEQWSSATPRIRNIRIHNLLIKYSYFQGTFRHFSIPQQPLLTTCKNFLNFPRKLKYYFENIFLKSPPLRAERSQYRLDRIFWTLACEAFRNIYLSLRHKLEKEKFCILFEKFDNFLNKYIFGILILTFEYQ